MENNSLNYLKSTSIWWLHSKTLAIWNSEHFITTGAQPNCSKMAHLIISPRLRTSYALKTAVTVGPIRDLTWKLWMSRRTSTLTKKDPVAQRPKINERKLLLKWEIESLQYNGTSTELHGYNELTLAEESSVKEGKTACHDGCIHWAEDEDTNKLGCNCASGEMLANINTAQLIIPTTNMYTEDGWKPGRKLVGNIAYSCCHLFFSAYIISHCQIHLVQNVPVRQTVSTQPVGLLSPVF